MAQSSQIMSALYARTHLWQVVACALALLAFAGTGEANVAQGWRIDEAHTWIGFKIDAVGFPTTRGHFNHYSGKVFIDFDRDSMSKDSMSKDATGKRFHEERRHGKVTVSCPLRARLTWRAHDDFIASLKNMPSLS